MAIVQINEAIESMSQFASMWKTLTRTLPGVDLTDRKGAAIRWADHTFPFWNCIFLTEELDQNALSVHLQEGARYMRQKSQSGLLWVCEELLSDSAKESLPSLLQEAQLEMALPVTGMAGEMFPLHTAVPSTLRLERVTNHAMLQEYIDINCDAYGLPLAAGESALDPEIWLNAYSYLGYEGDRAVTAASAIVNEGCLFLALVATRAEARGKGYAEAVVRQALQAGHEATGLTRTILHATDAGFPVYKRVGYYKTASILAYKLASAANA
jgi:hypothetical protein